jgi:hypothetical protein
MAGYKYFGSPLPGMGEYPSADEVGVWWTQATFSDGLAEWRCWFCGKYGHSLSIWWARLRHWAHCRRCHTTFRRSDAWPMA